MIDPFVSLDFVSEGRDDNVKKLFQVYLLLRAKRHSYKSLVVRHFFAQSKTGMQITS